MWKLRFISAKFSVKVLFLVLSTPVRVCCFGKILFGGTHVLFKIKKMRWRCTHVQSYVESNVKRLPVRKKTREIDIFRFYQQRVSAKGNLSVQPFLQWLLPDFQKCIAICSIKLHCLWTIASIYTLSHNVKFVTTLNFYKTYVLTVKKLGSRLQFKGFNKTENHSNSNFLFVCEAVSCKLSGMQYDGSYL